MRKYIALLFMLVVFAKASFAAEMPDEAQLSANRMRFDSKTGDFLATGNVVIRADGLNVFAPRGTGNVQRKEVLFSEGVVASGDWQGEWIDLTAGSLSLFLGRNASYSAENGVKGAVGKITVDADSLSMQGSDLSAVNVRRLEDLEMDIAFGADDVKGTLENGVLTALTAKTKVWLQGRPNSSGEMVDIRGGSAVYSVERGSVVISGNVRAIQKGRTLTSPSVVYFPKLNRVEAIGSASGGRAVISIDLRQENRR